jgi:hypothetical protein
MGIDCSSLGRALIIRRDGTRNLLSLDETKKICMEAMERGLPFHEIAKINEPNLKVIRFVDENEADD